MVKETREGFYVGDVLVTLDLRCTKCQSKSCRHVRAVKEYLVERGRLVYIYHLPPGVLWPKPTAIIEGKPAYVSARREITVYLRDGGERRLRGRPVSLRYAASAATPIPEE